MRDEKVHAVVARSTFPSEHIQNTPLSDHFWKLQCRKSARRCGAKHISKSKCTKHIRSGPLLEVEMSKKCTPLWREAHFEVKMYKTPFSYHFWKLRCLKSARRCGREAHFQVKILKSLGVRTTFGSCDVEKVHAVVARSTFPSQNVQNTTCSRHFWRFGCWKSARRCGVKHISKSKYTKHHMFAPLLEVQMSKKCTPLWHEVHFENVQNTTCSRHFWRFRCRFASLHYITLHYTTLHYTTLHYTTLQLQLHNYTPLHSTTLNYTTLHYITLQYTPLHYITLHCLPLPLHYITLHYTTLHPHYNYNYNYDYTTTLYYTPLHEITLHYTTLHYTPLHSTTLHYITLPYITLNDTAPQIDM